MLMFVWCILDSEVVPKLGSCSCSWFSCPSLMSLRCFFKRFEGIVVKLRCLSRMSRTLYQTYTWRWWNGKISYTSNDHKVLKPSSCGWAQWILENLLRLFENLSTIFPNHKNHSFAHLNEAPARNHHWSSNRTISFTLEKTSNSWIEGPFLNTFFFEKRHFPVIVLHHHRNKKKHGRMDVRPAFQHLSATSFWMKISTPWDLAPLPTPIESPHRLLPWKLTKWNLKTTIKIKWEGISEDVTHNISINIYKNIYHIRIYICIYHMYISYVDHTSSSKPPFWLPFLGSRDPSLNSTSP